MGCRAAVASHGRAELEARVTVGAMQRVSLTEKANRRDKTRPGKLGTRHEDRSEWDAQTLAR